MSSVMRCNSQPWAGDVRATTCFKLKTRNPHERRVSWAHPEGFEPAHLTDEFYDGLEQESKPHYENFSVLGEW